jgi:hypothetical protein
MTAHDVLGSPRNAVTDSPEAADRKEQLYIMFRQTRSGARAAYGTLASYAEESGFDFRAGTNDFSSSPQLSDRLWGPLSLLCNGYQGFLWRGVKLTSNYYPVPKLRIRGVIFVFMELCLIK